MMVDGESSLLTILRLCLLALFLGHQHFYYSLLSLHSQEEGPLFQGFSRLAGTQVSNPHQLSSNVNVLTTVL